MASLDVVLICPLQPAGAAAVSAAADKRWDEYVDTVLCAIRTLRRHMHDPDAWVSATACLAVIRLEAARIRHRRAIAGTEGAKPWDLDLSGVLAGTEGLFAGAPGERGRPGRTPAGQKRRSAETAEAAAGGSQSGR